MSARQRRPKALLWFLGGGIIVGIITVLLLTTLTSPPILPVMTSTTTPASVSAAKTVWSTPFKQPIRLMIPKIGVDTRIDQMGITSDGLMESPDGGQNAGWYKFGPQAGNKGAAVIAGHYGRWANGTASVFDHLQDLKPGDKIHVQDITGATATFIVQRSQLYDRDKRVPEVFIAPDAGAYLNLITCQGTWDKAKKTYSDRLVVFTSKQE